MGYTTTEKQAALAALTQQELTFTRNAFKGRDTSATYAQLRELVLTGLFYEPDAAFALADIAADYWASQVTAQRRLIADLQEDLGFILSKDRVFGRLDTLRRAKTLLGKARVAASVQGKVAPRPLERYRRLVDTALEDMSRQTVQAGASLLTSGKQVVKSRRSAQQAVSSNFSTLVSDHAKLRDGLALLRTMVADYESAESLAQLTSIQLQRLDDMVGGVVDDLETLSEEEARQEMRTYFLNLLGGQALARRLEERESGSTPRMSVSSDYRMAPPSTTTSPSITGSKCAPWPLEQGGSDKLRVDFSGTEVEVNLVPASEGETGIEAASVIGAAFGPFRVVDDNSLAGGYDPVALLTQKITSGTNYSVSGTNLYLIVDGETWTVAFGSDQTATAVAATINAVSGITVNATPQSGGGLDWVSIAYNNGSPPDRRDQRLMSVVTGVSNAADLAPWRLDGPSGEVAGTRSQGADQRDTLLLYVNDSATPTTVTLTPGVWPDYERTAAQVATDISGTGFEASGADNRITISSTLKGELSRIGIATDMVAGGAETVIQRTLTGLGFVENTESKEADIPISQVISVLNASTTFAAQAVAKSARQTLYEVRSAEVPAASSNEVRFYVGTTDPSTGWDLSETKAAIHTGGNQGTYDISSKTYSSPNLTLELVRDLRDTSTTSRFALTVISERLSIESTDTDVGAYVQVKTPAQSAHTALGFTTAQVTGTSSSVLIEKNDPVKGWVPADLRPFNLRVGDVIYDNAGVELTRVTGVSRLDEGIVSVNDVSSDFSVTSGFVISSGAYIAHREFLRQLRLWRPGFSSYDDDTLQVIAKLLYPQLRTDSPIRDRVVAASAKLTEYDGLLADLETVLTGFSVTRPLAVSQAIRALQEHGHDRARNLLIQGDLGEFLGLTSQGSTRSQYLMAKINDVAISDVNEPTFFDDEEEGELERFMVGYEEDDNPAFEVEDEEQWPDSPIAPRPLNPVTVTPDDLGYTPIARGAKR